MVDIIWPNNPILERGLIVVDSPGMGDWAVLEEMVKEYVNKVDLVIICTNGPQTLKPLEEQMLKKVATQLQHERVFIVANKWDQVARLADIDFEIDPVEKEKKN